MLDYLRHLTKMSLILSIYTTGAHAASFKLRTKNKGCLSVSAKYEDVEYSPGSAQEQQQIDNIWAKIMKQVIPDKLKGTPFNRWSTIKRAQEQYTLIPNKEAFKDNLDAFIEQPTRFKNGFYVSIHTSKKRINILNSDGSFLANHFFQNNPIDSLKSNHGITDVGIKGPGRDIHSIDLSQYEITYMYRISASSNEFLVLRDNDLINRLDQGKSQAIRAGDTEDSVNIYTRLDYRNALEKATKIDESTMTQKIKEPGIIPFDSENYYHTRSKTLLQYAVEGKGWSPNYFGGSQPPPVYKVYFEPIPNEPLSFNIYGYHNGGNGAEEGYYVIKQSPIKKSI